MLDKSIQIQFVMFCVLLTTIGNFQGKKEVKWEQWSIYDVNSPEFGVNVGLHTGVGNRF